MEPFERNHQAENRLRAVDQAISTLRPFNPSLSSPAALDIDVVIATAQKIVDFAEGGVTV